MFNLEQSIVEWRQQMLDAGIETPAPLEELEFHLREEIERRINSGLSELEAFKAAVQNIGQGHALQSEFIKVEHEFKTKRAVLLTLRATVLIFGWMAAAYALMGGVLGLDFHWNFFNFHTEWDLKTLKIIVKIFAIETGFWYLAKASRDRITRVISLFLCLFLVVSAMSCLHPEQVKPLDIHPTDSVGVMWIKAAMHRKAPSPLWYRGGLAFLFLLPGMFWIWWERRHIIQERLSAMRGQAVHSN